MTIVAKVVRIDVGAQLVHGQLARLVTLFATEAGGSVCTAFDREHYLRLIQALQTEPASISPRLPHPITPSAGQNAWNLQNSAHLAHF